MLAGMRADHLLAASLAGTLDGLRNALSIAITSEAAVKPSLLQAKALGDTGGDLVYTPITPCRIVDTVSVGGAIPALGTRSFKGTTATNFLAQGGSNSTCGIPLSAAGLQTAVTVVSPPQNGYLLVYPFGAPQPTAFTMIYQANTIASTAVTIPLTKGQANEFTAFLERTAFLQVDVVGYFKAPSGGYVSSVMAGTGLTGGTITSSGTIAADTTYLQRRVGSTCAVGSSIRAIAADGTVTCQADSIGPANAVRGGRQCVRHDGDSRHDRRPAARPAARGGFVGIGTATPNSKFNVVGTSWFQGDTHTVARRRGQRHRRRVRRRAGLHLRLRLRNVHPQEPASAEYRRQRRNRDGHSNLRPAPRRRHLGNCRLRHGDQRRWNQPATASRIGASTATADSSYGVGGRSNTQIGVYGQSFAALSAGVYGLSRTSARREPRTALTPTARRFAATTAGAPPGMPDFSSATPGSSARCIKNAGAFRIDHPLDPANKYLSHSFVESPDMKNIYDGIVTTDGNGMGAVAAAGLVRGAEQGLPLPAHRRRPVRTGDRGQEIQDNRFGIQTDKPQVKVSWQVTGIRHDTYAAQHRIQVEEDKPADQRGTYIHPAGHGRAQKASLGVRTRSAATTTAQALK